jgi:hypothetical protein
MEEQHARARRRFDADGSGTISQAEVTAALRCLGVPVRRLRSVASLAAPLPRAGPCAPAVQHAVRSACMPARPRRHAVHAGACTCRPLALDGCRRCARV